MQLVDVHPATVAVITAAAALAAAVWAIVTIAPDTVTKVAVGVVFGVALTPLSTNVQLRFGRSRIAAAAIVGAPELYSPVATSSNVVLSANSRRAPPPLTTTSATRPSGRPLTCTSTVPVPSVAHAGPPPPSPPVPPVASLGGSSSPLHPAVSNTTERAPVTMKR